MPAASSPGFVPLTDLVAAFPGPTLSARRQSAHRWALALTARGQARKLAGRREVSLEARLPDGLTVESYLNVGRVEQLVGFTLPPGHQRWSDRDRERFLNSHELLTLWEATKQCRAGHLPASESFALFIARHADDVARLGFKHLSLRTLRRIRRRLDPNSGADFDGNVRRRRAKRGRGACTPEAWELFRSLYLQSNGLKLTKCWRFVQGEAAQHGWVWPSESTIRQRVKDELHPSTLTLARRGPKRFEADCVPKCERDFESMLAGEWWCLDGRTLDFKCRVPDARREWRPARLVVTGVLDMRSRSLRLDVRSTEYSDGILAGIQQALRDWGAPEHVIADNGEAYKAALGSRRGSGWQKKYMADPRIGSVFAKLGVTLHSSIPYHGWAKPLESIWDKLKEDFDRWLWSWCGGSPAERPEGHEREIKRRIDDLPTEDDVREWLPIWLGEYHATAQSGKGTRGLCPNLVMEQYRAPIRRVDLDVVAQLSTRTVGPVKRGRDGFRWKHILYGRWDEEVWRLKDDRYYLTIEPERADRVTVCDSDGAPICYAHNRQLGGASQDDRREAARLQARYRRVHREAAQARDYLRETPTAQILQAKRRHAQAREAEQRKQLPAPEPPAVTIVRPDLAAAAARLHRQEQKTVVRQAVERPSKPRRSGFDKLAALAEYDEQQHTEQRPITGWERLNYETEAAG